MYEQVKKINIVFQKTTSLPKKKKKKTFGRNDYYSLIFYICAN